MTALERVLDALRAHSGDVRRNGAGHIARCPTHQDRNPSLAVAQGNEGAVLLCHAGCATKDIVAAIGLTMRDLFDTPHPNGQQRSSVVAEYRYTDEAGRLLYVKERHTPKDFRLKRPDGTGGWIWKNVLRGAPRLVLYRLPEITAAVTAGLPVFVVEGEKDADALAARGLVATTNVEGAAKPGQRPKWRPEYGDQLGGATVIVIADRDDAGYAHAAAVAADLAGKAASVTVCQAAAGNDVSDHLAADLGLDRLMPVDPTDLAEPRTSAATENPVRDEPATEQTRPEFDVSLPADAADWLRGNIGTGRLAGMFNRTGDIVHTPREDEDGYVPLTGDDDTDGPAQVRPVTPSALASRMSYTYWCFRWAGPKDDPVKVHATFPATAAKVPVDVPDMLPNLRRLRGVTHTPVLRRDGTLLTAPGYDQASGLLHLPEPGLDMPPVPDTPTAVQIEAAAVLLHEMIAGFPFVTAHHKANYLGALLTPMLRQITPPPYKLTAITAPQPGSGKTLLATVNRIIHGGVFRAEMPEDEAELRKQISAILDVTTGPVIHIDNVTGMLRSSTLSGLLTSADWDDRRLGSNEMISRRNDRLWMITGNNIAIGGDLPRRTIPVEIDPGVPNPERRTGFAITDLETWVRERRGELLAALLTLARAWVVAGRPAGGQAGSDSYTTWVRAVRGILATAGMPGVFDHDDTRLDVGTDDDDWRNFLIAARAAFGDATWSVKELLAKVDTGDEAARFTDGYAGEAARQWLAAHPIPLDALPADLADKAARSRAGLSVIAKSLGRWLANRDGRWAGDLSVRQAGKDSHDKFKLWRVQVYEPAGFAGTAGFIQPDRAGDPQEQNITNRTRDENDRAALGEKNPAEPANPAAVTCPPWTPRVPGEICLTCGATADLCPAATTQQEMPA